MRLAFSCLFVLFFFFQSARAQQNAPLFTYGSDTVYTEEFVRVFLKNNKKEEQTDSSLKAYLNLYINFKLKVKEAVQLGMAEDPAFQQELAGYREQLARTYMTDTSLTTMLMAEAYERMKTEVNASHILILVSPNALPKDTMRAYNRIKELRNKAIAGMNFDTLAYYNSEDNSAKSNFGNLGYFSAFEMIYPFETQAFQTNTGEISQIFRTEFGYHILKVKDKRAYRGEVKVAHLMLRLNTNAKEEEILESKRKIDSIYGQLINGADWGKMVSSYSEDASSIQNGGELNWIRTNSPVALPFREAAFSIANPGEYSKPVHTDFGWHIIKLIEKRPLASMDELSERLRMQVNREPERVKMSQESLVARFKMENGFVENSKNRNSLIARLDSSILKATFKAEMNAHAENPLFRIGDRTLYGKDFYTYIEKYQTPQSDISINTAAENLYKGFVVNEVLRYQNDHLEEKYPDFRYLMQEYHDGILLFNLTQAKVWDKAVQDTAGLKAYYEAHKTEHVWADRVQASIYECNSKEAYKQTKKLLKKGVADVEISQQVNEKNPLSLVIKHSKFERGENPQVDAVQWKPGTYTVKTEDGKYYLIKISEFVPAAPKAFKEVKGIMTGKYQDELEKQWIEDLKSRYPVSVNDDILNSILD
ncbi:MAG TPA: peptidylprolyl isomerase [Bacteroidetes bacterium]|nr:peptidylprolyl isomerase [Bacteroidota bacterium]